jgi:hypothetical protein
MTEVYRSPAEGQFGAAGASCENIFADRSSSAGATGDADLKSVVIVSAILLALVGYLASATSPNPSDHLAGKVLIAIAAGFVALALYAPPKVTASVYFGSIALVIVAYSLPMSFWRAVGLAKERSSQNQDSGPSTRDSE